MQTFDLPLHGITVVDLSQFLSGPSAGLRMADLGARVIKVERPGTGDICRTLYVSDTRISGESTIFHAINRNKESFVADLKEEAGKEQVLKLISHADVVLHNFRPGVMERLGLSYEEVKAIHPSIIYGSISGYGEEGEWRDLPGQDLLLQAVSGITFLNGEKDDNPMPMGVAVADILAGTHLVQGILTALYNRNVTGEGALVEVSMLESLLDFQFEVLGSHYNDGRTHPERSAILNGHAYLGAPYGIYQTADGYLALAMGNIPFLGELLDCPPLLPFKDPAGWYEERDQIKSILEAHLRKQNTENWLAILEAADIWCARVMDYDQLMQHEGYQVLQMEQEVISHGIQLTTTRCPIRLDGQRLYSSVGAPALGENTQKIVEEFKLKVK